MATAVGRSVPGRAWSESPLAYRADEMAVIRDDELCQGVKSLRKTIEPNPSEPHYLITWRGRSEGGYQCFLEGGRGGKRAAANCWSARDRLGRGRSGRAAAVFHLSGSSLSAPDATTESH